MLLSDCIFLFSSAQLHLLLFHACADKLKMLFTHINLRLSHLLYALCQTAASSHIQQPHGQMFSVIYSVDSISLINHTLLFCWFSDKRKYPAWTIKYWPTASGFLFTGSEPECVLILDIEGPGYMVTHAKLAHVCLTRTVRQQRQKFPTVPSRRMYRLDFPKTLNCTVFGVDFLTDKTVHISCYTS